MIGPEKSRNFAIFGGRLFTSGCGRRPRMPLRQPAFSAAVHLAHSVPACFFLVSQSVKKMGPNAEFEVALGWPSGCLRNAEQAGSGRRQQSSSPPNFPDSRKLWTKSGAIRWSVHPWLNCRTVLLTGSGRRSPPPGRHVTHGHHRTAAWRRYPSLPRFARAASTKVVASGARPRAGAAVDESGAS
jgi:hypothetical protein